MSDFAYLWSWGDNTLHWYVQWAVMRIVAVPEEGCKLWRSTGDGHVEEVVEEVKEYHNGDIKVFTGRYRLNKAGIELAGGENLYSNEHSGVSVEAFKEWGFKRKHLKKVWRGSRELCVPFQPTMTLSLIIPREMLEQEIRRVHR